MASGALHISALFPRRAPGGSPRRRTPTFCSPTLLPPGPRAVNRPPPHSSSAHLRSRTIPPIRASEGSDQAGNGGFEGYQLKHVGTPNWAKPVLSFAGANFLPLALVSGIVLGLANPALGCLAHKYTLSKYSTFGIFVISGLTLRSGEIGAAAEAWPAGLFGLASILLFSPSLSRFILYLNLTPQEFVNGLAIFFCMPTTLSSGVALTNLVKGNSALALAMTVLSNLSGILLVPFLLSKVIGQGIGVSIPITPLLKSLTVTLLIPLIFGKVLRDSFSRHIHQIRCGHDQEGFYRLVQSLFAGASSILIGSVSLGSGGVLVLRILSLLMFLWIAFQRISRDVARYVDKNRHYFSYANSILLSLVPWMQVSHSRSLLLSVNPASLLLAVILGIWIPAQLILQFCTFRSDIVHVEFGLAMVLHIFLLMFNAIALWSISAVSYDGGSIFMKKENARAVIIVASQKTLPVMVAVVEQLGGAFGESALLVLPCVAIHINQERSLLFSSYTGFQETRSIPDDNHRLFPCELLAPKRSSGCP